MINTEIKARQVRLIKEDGQNEVLDTIDALKMAQEAELDLICINTNGEIPVVKIGDYKKFCYDKKKAEKEAKRKTFVPDTKEIRIGDSIDTNDLKTKARQIDKFLTNRDKVKLTIRYRGRAISRIKEGPAKLGKLTDLVTEEYVIDVPAKIMGNSVTMTIAPKK